MTFEEVREIFKRLDETELKKHGLYIKGKVELDIDKLDLGKPVYWYLEINIRHPAEYDNEDCICFEIFEWEERSHICFYHCDNSYKNKDYLKRVYKDCEDILRDYSNDSLLADKTR